MSLPTVMQAWVSFSLLINHKALTFFFLQSFSKAGSPQDVLKLIEKPVPTPEGTQILIKVHAAALNPVGWKGISLFPLSYFHAKPAVPESDFAGVVVGGKMEGTEFKLGDEVFG